MDLFGEHSEHSFQVDHCLQEQLSAESDADLFNDEPTVPKADKVVVQITQESDGLLKKGKRRELRAAEIELRRSNRERRI